MTSLIRKLIKINLVRKGRRLGGIIGWKTVPIRAPVRRVFNTSKLEGRVVTPNIKLPKKHQFKCLSVKQPFADLIVNGIKTIELRTWNTNLRGQFLIHASNKMDEEVCTTRDIDPKLLVRGAVIGKAVLYDVKEYKSKEEFLADKDKHLAPERYADHKYGFMIKEAIRLDEPVYMRGRLNFFDVDISSVIQRAKN